MYLLSGNKSTIYQSNEGSEWKRWIREEEVKGEGKKKEVEGEVPNPNIAGSNLVRQTIILSFDFVCELRVFDSGSIMSPASSVAVDSLNY